MARFALYCAAIGAAFSAACVGATQGGKTPELTLTQTIDMQLARDGAIPWAARRPLVWADFKGKPPSADEEGVVAAETAYTLIHGTRCNRSTFEFKVLAAFRPGESWVRHDLLKTAAQSARALRHEQTHFDLTEVHARRLRRNFAELLAPCRSSTGDLAAMAARIGRDEQAAQAQYDAETDNGRNNAQQARWDKEVAAQLTALAKFSK
jgi:hypothetical protein